MSVLSVSCSQTHAFSKPPTAYIYLLANQGVQGDIHCSPSPSPSNLRQVHIIDDSLFSDLAIPSSKHPTFLLSPGALGENITTRGIDLFALAENTRLYFGDDAGCAIVRVTGLRDPKKRLNEWPEGLLERCTKKDKLTGKKVYRVGIMGVVEREGWVQPGYSVFMEEPGLRRRLKGV